MAKNYFMTAALMLAILHLVMAEDKSQDLETFFEKKNISSIKWAHAINSQLLLKNALEDKNINMLEADVSMGMLFENRTVEIPIMAHPPHRLSDLSLEKFIETVLANGKKGMKLDFKTIEAFTNSKPILQKFIANLTVPIVLNADILPGPVKPNQTEVDATQFLSIAKETLPKSTLSIGWTTSFDNSTFDGIYTQQHIDAMINVVSKNNLTTQSVTYPVRAGLAVNSKETLSTLLTKTQSHKPTLTIWSGENDIVNASMLQKLIKDIGVEKVYLDLPEDLMKQIDVSSASSFTIGSSIAIVLTAFLYNFAFY